jgi:hypothetical protein
LPRVVFVAAYVHEIRHHGLQVLTLKHYVANSLDNTIVDKSVVVDGQNYTAGDNINRHNVDVRVSNYMLQEYLAAFRAAAKVGVKGMMCSCKSSL